MDRSQFKDTWSAADLFLSSWLLKIRTTRQFLTPPLMTYLSKKDAAEESFSETSPLKMEQKAAESHTSYLPCFEMFHGY